MRCDYCPNAKGHIVYLGPLCSHPDKVLCVECLEDYCKMTGRVYVEVKNSQQEEEDDTPQRKRT